MKEIVGVFSHYNYVMFLERYEELSALANIKIYSVKLLKEGRQKLIDLYKDAKESEILILNRVASEELWNEIENEINKEIKEKIYIGEELINYVGTDEITLKKAIKCNEYFSFGGKENLEQMIKFLCGIDCIEPKEIPWEGIYDIESGKNFQTVEEYLEEEKVGKGRIAIITARSYWLNNDLNIERTFVEYLNEKGYNTMLIYGQYNNDGQAYEKLLKKFCLDKEGNSRIDAIIKMVSFGLVDGEKNNLLKKLNCPIFKPIISSNLTIEEWEKSSQGAVKDIQWSVCLPELEGNIEPIFVGANIKYKNREKRVANEERCRRASDRIIKYIQLKKLKNEEKKVVFILNNNPCSSVEGNIGSAANLDSLESIVNLMKEMKKEGYKIKDIPENGQELSRRILEKKAISEFRWTTVEEIVKKGGALDLLEKEQYEEWFEELEEESKKKIIETWGNPPGEEIDGVPKAMIYDGKIVISGLSFGNVIVCVQPKRGCAGSRCDGKVCKILHDPSIPPTHQYIGTYKWFEKVFKANGIIHVGTHGNLEFLPGKAIGLSNKCYSDICINTTPYFNIYNSDNPPEGIIAKRRGLATIIDHMQTVIKDGKEYGGITRLENLINEYERNRHKDISEKHITEHLIGEEIKKLKLDNKIEIDSIHKNIEDIIEKVKLEIALVMSTQIEDGKHIIGKVFNSEEIVDMINGILRFESEEKISLRGVVSEILGMKLENLLVNKSKFNVEYQKLNSRVLKDIEKIAIEIIKRYVERKTVIDEKLYKPYKVKDKRKMEQLELAFRGRVEDIEKRIKKSKELESILEGLKGNYIESGPAGVINRGRDDVLPTGRNFYTEDQNLLPTKAAYEIGKRLAEKVIEKHIREEGKYPENFAMYLMANDFMWSDGEGMAQLLYLIGVKPIWSYTGKVIDIEIIPLEELGRPRIDVTIKISGIVRDTFFSRVEILDEAIRKVANLKEDLEMNYIRKHTIEYMKKLKLEEGSIDENTSRIFGNKIGTYFSAITGVIYSSSWEDKQDIADIFTYYNSYKYGKEKLGEQNIDEFKNLLGSVDITYNKISADSHDLLGCCTYFSTHGGMTTAATKISGKEVKSYYGDTRETKAIEVRDLSEELDRIVRGKLLNEMWIDGQKRHGYVGAAEISNLVGRVYGWDATTDKVDDKLFDGIADTFILDEENRKFFEENNKYAFEEIGRRMIEAYKREVWNTTEERINNVQEIYLEAEGWIEDEIGEFEGDLQGGSIDIVSMDELEEIRSELSKY